MARIRFSRCKDSKDMWKVFDWETGETLNFKQIINLLNELVEENRKLQQCINAIYIISSRESVE